MIAFISDVFIVIFKKNVIIDTPVHTVPKYEQWINMGKKTNAHIYIEGEKQKEKKVCIIRKYPIFETTTLGKNFNR